MSRDKTDPTNISQRLNDATPADWDRASRRARDVVHSPPHYNAGGIECIDAIESSMETENFKGYLKGNTLKYIWRMSYKGKALEDLQKAQWYLTKLINTLEDDT